ncbi:MAG: hypothetical protein ACI9FO_000581, partial [Methylophagaceae bacterium]
GTPYMSLRAVKLVIYAVVACITTFSIPLLANEAVRETNYSGITSWEHDEYDSEIYSKDNDKYSVAGTITVSVFKYFGLASTVQAEAYSLDYKAGGEIGYQQHDDLDSYQLRFDFFARKFDLGKVGVGYAYQYNRYEVKYKWLQYRDSSRLKETEERDVFFVSADYYLDRVTLLSRYHRKKGPENNSDASDARVKALGLRFYAHDNVSLSVSREWHETTKLI